MSPRGFLRMVWTLSGAVLVLCAVLHFILVVGWLALILSVVAVLGEPGARGETPKADGARATRRGQFVWFLHFHKAAGTTFCQLALDNGLKLAPYEPGVHGHLELSGGAGECGDLDLEPLSPLGGLPTGGFASPGRGAAWRSVALFARLRSARRVPWRRASAARDPR